MEPFRWSRLKLRVFPIVTVFACLLALPSMATAALTGPIYPLPGSASEGHGGNVCAATNSTAGVAGGITWTFGGGGDTATTDLSCPLAGVDPPGQFNTNRFAKLYWGSDGSAGKRPGVSMDGPIDVAAETLIFALGESDRSQGKLVWSGTTHMDWCNAAGCGAFTNSTIDTRLPVTITDMADTPVNLDDPATVGISNAEVGGVVGVTDGLRNFKANLQVLARFQGDTDFQPAETFFNGFHHPPTGSLYRTEFQGAFWYENKAPNATFSAPNHQNPDSPITFTAQVSDDDGSVTGFAWDLNDDGKFEEFAQQANAQWAFAPGPHRVRLRAIDNEGTATIFTRMLHIGPRTDADGDGYLTPADCAPANAAINPGAAEIHDNGVDENCNGNGDDPDLDRDRDGFPRPGDCDDNSAAIHPGAADVPENGVDENCDGADAKLAQVPANFSYTFKASRKSTKLTSLTATLVPAGSTVTVTCKPKKKCGKKARKKFTKRNASGTVRLKKFVTTYKVGAVIEIRVTHAGMKGVVKRIKIRRSKAPVVTTLCLSPGARTPTRCT